MKTSSAAVKGNQNMLVRILKGALFASAVSILLVVIYAILLWQGWIKEGGMSVVNTIIKVLCAGFASYLAVRKCQKNRWIFGALTGLVYIIVSFVVFSILAGQVSFSLALLSDLAVGALAGMITAMLVEMLRPRRSK